MLYISVSVHVSTIAFINLDKSLGSHDEKATRGTENRPRCPGMKVAQHQHCATKPTTISLSPYSSQSDKAKMRAGRDTMASIIWDWIASRCLMWRL
jgi:hypothetical protein